MRKQCLLLVLIVLFCNKNYGMKKLITLQKMFKFNSVCSVSQRFFGTSKAMCQPIPMLKTDEEVQVFLKDGLELFAGVLESGLMEIIDRESSVEKDSRLCVYERNGLGRFKNSLSIWREIHNDLRSVVYNFNVVTTFMSYQAISELNFEENVFSLSDIIDYMNIADKAKRFLDPLVCATPHCQFLTNNVEDIQLACQKILDINNKCIKEDDDL